MSCEVEREASLGGEFESSRDVLGPLFMQYAVPPRPSDGLKRGWVVTATDDPDREVAFPRRLPGRQSARQRVTGAFGQAAYGKPSRTVFG